MNEIVELHNDVFVLVESPNYNSVVVFDGLTYAVSAHSSLSGLGADDHLQYLRTDGTRVLTGALRFGEIIDSGLAAADQVWVHAEDVAGFSQLHANTPTFKMNVMQDNWLVARNMSGSAMTPLQVVIVNGTTGLRPEVGLADALNNHTILGVTIQGAANNNYLPVMVGGIIEGVNTSAWIAGDRLYLSTVPGALTNISPAYPNYSVEVGIVLNSHATQGRILIHQHEHSDPVGSVAAHEAAGDPHPQYLTPAEGDLFYSPLGHNHVHSALSGLSVDDHAQYALLAGRAGGQILFGGSGAGENLTLTSTSNAAKGNIYLRQSSTKYLQIQDDADTFLFSDKSGLLSFGVVNSGAGAGDNAALEATTSAALGNPYIRFGISGGVSYPWSLGLNRNASDRIEIANADSLGTNTRFTMTQAGAADFAVSLSVGGTAVSLEGHTHDHGTLTGLGDDDHPQYVLHTEVDDVPVDGATTDPVSSNWAFDHVAAADPHPGYRLESADHTHQSTGLQGGQLDHGLALTGLTDDDHTQYALLAGRAGGQTLIGGTAASENLTLNSTSNATKGLVQLSTDGGHVAIGGAAAASELRFLEPSAGGTSYTGFKAPALAANVIYTLPIADGANGNSLITDGAGNLSWATAGVSDHGALSGLADDDHTQYLLASGTRALTGNWDAGSFDIRAQNLTADALAATGIVYTGTAGLLSVNTLFNWDNASGRMKIGTTQTPTNANTIVPTFTISGSGIAAAFQVTRHTAPGGGGAIMLLSATRGTDADSHTILQSGDGVGTLNFCGSDGTDYDNYAGIQVAVDATPSANSPFGRMMFQVADGSGANSLQEAMRIDRNRQVTIGGPSTAPALAVVRVASQNRWVTITGSVSGNPTISTSAGSLAITPATTFASTISMSTAASQLIPGATSFAIRNNANSANNLLLNDAGTGSMRDALTISKTIDGFSDMLQLTNDSTGTSAAIRLRLGNNVATGRGQLILYGGSHATLPGDVELTSVGRNVRILQTNALAATFEANGLTLVNGLAVAGATLSTSTGIVAPAATTSLSSIRLPHGTAPTTPVDGDMWTTSTGLFVRINGATIGPLT